MKMMLSLLPQAAERAEEWGPEVPAADLPALPTKSRAVGMARFSFTLHPSSFTLFRFSPTNSTNGREHSIQNSPKSALESLQAIENNSNTHHGLAGDQGAYLAENICFILMDWFAAGLAGPALI